MKQLRDEAFVLATHRLGEADVIVALLTEHGGSVRGVARGARKSRRRFGGALEPMTRVQASWIEREGRELHRIESLEPRRSFAAMQAEPAAQAACAVVAEIVGATVQEGQGDPRLFRLVAAVLEALEAGLAPTAVVRYFELWTLRLHGLLPDLDGCGLCGRQLPNGARAWAAAGHGLLCAGCRGRSEGAARVLRAADRSFLRAALAGPPTSVADHAAGASSGALELLLRGTLQAFVERGLRSYRHLESASLAAPNGGTKK